MSEWFKGRKPLGAVIRRRDGNVYVKTRDGWMAESRLVAQHKIINRDLEKGEKVYHVDCTRIGEPDYNGKDNLVVLKFRTTKYRLLPHPEVVFLPTARGESKPLAHTAMSSR